MKTLAIEKEKRSIAEVLSAEDGKDVIYLTKKGRPAYALVPLDEMDREILAIRNNPELMAYLDACSERARTGPCKSIEQIREELGIPRRKRKKRR
ncbi:MAG: type II toxin-antitoxin system prevent-host-death family antitoxin [Planctomycetes bacterium]|nr:type II toxin-antitoxin system prevent-host-death family antitoxin [Planctomycetota bacterium]